uniref:Uncharacterized protein n=4 Tax=Anopheles albimanus TaxID=7167 RepID=A0A182F9U3_ANOAL
MSLLVVCIGSLISSESSESNEYEVRGIPEIIRKKCKSKTGSNAAFSAVLISVGQTRMCIEDLHPENLKLDINELTNATRGVFFAKFCPLARSFVSCHDSTVAGVRPCLEEGMFNMVQAFFNKIPEVLDLVCKNDGEILFKLMDEQHKECIKQKANQLATCVNSLNGNWEDSKLTQEQCSKLTNFGQCLKIQMDLCDFPEFTNIYDIPMNAMLSLTPCGNYTHEPNGYLPDNNSTVDV